MALNIFRTAAAAAIIAVTSAGAASAATVTTIGLEEQESMVFKSAWSDEPLQETSSDNCYEVDFHWEKSRVHCLSPFKATGDAGDLSEELSQLPGVVPLPAAGWMLLAGLGGIAAIKRRRKAA